MLAQENSKKLLKICVLPGDGIGKEVTEAAIPVFSLLKLSCELHVSDIGWECWRTEGNAIPQKTWDLITTCDAILLGAVTSKPLLAAERELPVSLQGKHIRYVSPVIQLRQQLNLFANVRPISNFLNQEKSYRFCIIRENTEGLYAGLDFAVIPPDLQAIISSHRDNKSSWDIHDLPEASCTIRLQTKKATQRWFRFAFQYAKENAYEKITLADKPNVLRDSGNFLLTIFQDIAKDYPGIRWDVQNVDAVALNMIRHPEQLGVVVAENMFGDILSDVGAGVMGGLGLSASANLGSRKPYFEPVHGSVPKIVNQHKANPSAMFLTIALLLRHFNFCGAAEKIENAVRYVVRSGKKVTYDLDGIATTHEMATAILNQIKKST